MPPLSSEEVRKICEFVAAVAERGGLKVEPTYRVLFVKPSDAASLGADAVEVEEGVYVDPKGAVYVRSDLLANVAIEKVMAGLVSLILIRNFGRLSREYVREFVAQYYGEVIAYLYG